MSRNLREGYFVGKANGKAVRGAWLITRGWHVPSSAAARAASRPIYLALHTAVES